MISFVAHRFFSILLSLVLFAGSNALFSQETEKKEPIKKNVDLQNVQTPKSDQPLPKIDLPEFVITGNETIELNIESKRTNEQDRIFSPTRPTPGERPINVGEALTPKQIKSFTKTPGSLNGKIFAGYGFFGTPQFDGWFGQYDPVGSIIVNGYYSESDGHVKDAGFWRGGFGVRGSYALPESSSVIPMAQVRAETKYNRESFRAFGSSSPKQIHDISRIDVNGGINSRYLLPYKSINGVDYSVNMGWGNYSASDSGVSTESEFNITGNASTQFFESTIKAAFEYRAAGYSMSLPNLQSGQWFVLRAEGKQLLLPSLQVSVSVQQFLYRGNLGATSGRLYPGVDLHYSLLDHVTLFTGFTPTVERNTLASLMKQNRYINTNAQITPSEILVQVYMGTEFTPMDEVTAIVKLEFEQIDNYPTFYDKNSAKVWEVLYLSGVRSTKFDCSAVYRLNQKQNVTAYFSTQKVKQIDSANAVPHLPNVTIGSIYHHFFDFGLHAEAFVELKSSRYTNFANSQSLSGNVYSGIKGEIEMFGQFRGYAELTNLLNRQNYLWDGYQERTIFLLLGVSYHW